ncbi:MAG: biotin/lipoyl-binding protein [Prevotella sp.]|nr:biotin/lipoyl-binding protein [Prevotella sp.]
MKEFKFNIDGKEMKATVVPQEDGKLAVTLNDTTYSVEVPELLKQAPRPVVNHAAAPAPVATKPIAATPVASNVVAAPLPGTITKVLVNEGDKVKKGDTLLTMEAMKMENSITAEADGIVRKIHVGVGASVNQGDALVDFEGLAVPQTAPAQAPAQKPAAAPAAAAPKAAPAAAAAAPAAGAHTVDAPLPGTIKQVCVAVGQEIAAGDTVVVMEAMKMENNITAEFGGKVTAVKVAVGDQVQSGQALVETA